MSTACVRAHGPLRRKPGIGGNGAIVDAAERKEGDPLGPLHRADDRRGVGDDRQRPLVHQEGEHRSDRGAVVERDGHAGLYELRRRAAQCALLARLLLCAVVVIALEHDGRKQGRPAAHLAHQTLLHQCVEIAMDGHPADAEHGGERIHRSRFRAAQMLHNRLSPFPRRHRPGHPNNLRGRVDAPPRHISIRKTRNMML